MTCRRRPAWSGRIHLLSVEALRRLFRRWRRGLSLLLHAQELDRLQGWARTATLLGDWRCFHAMSEGQGAQPGSTARTLRQQWFRRGQGGLCRARPADERGPGQKARGRGADAQISAGVPGRLEGIAGRERSPIRPVSAGVRRQPGDGLGRCVSADRGWPPFRCVAAVPGTTGMAGPTRSCCSMIRRPAWPRRSNGVEAGRRGASARPRKRMRSASSARFCWRGPGAGAGAAILAGTGAGRRAAQPWPCAGRGRTKAWSTWTARIARCCARSSDNGRTFQDGLARHVENGKMGFHDEALKVVIPARYDFAFPFRDGGPVRDGLRSVPGRGTLQRAVQVLGVHRSIGMAGAAAKGYPLWSVHGVCRRGHLARGRARH